MMAKDRAYKTIYFRIWQDALCNIKKHNPKDYTWMSLVFISMGNALNLLSLLILLNALFNVPILLFHQTHFCQIKPVDSLVKFCIQFFILPLLVNYYYIFHKKRYTTLTGSSETCYKGRLFAFYIFGTIIVLVFTIFLAAIYP